MLDEIINYVQSLQRQIEVSMHTFTSNLKNLLYTLTAPIYLLLPIEFNAKCIYTNFFTRTSIVLTGFIRQILSLKLAAVDPRLDSNMENLLNKEV